MNSLGMESQPPSKLMHTVFMHSNFLTHTKKYFLLLISVDYFVHYCLDVQYDLFFLSLGKSIPFGNIT